MRSIIAGVTLAVAVMLTVACVEVRTNVTVFHTLPAMGAQKTVALMPGNPTATGALEWSTYAAKLGVRLEAAGYKMVAFTSDPPADYIAFFSYGIDDGTLFTYSSPTYGVTGYSRSTTTGTITGNTVNATTTYTPEYGVTGSELITDRVYKRAILFDVFDRTKLRLDDSSSFAGAQVYSARLMSEGRCSSLTAVVEPMLTAMFEDFPGQSGTSRRVDVPLEMRC